MTRKFIILTQNPVYYVCPKSSYYLFLFLKNCLVKIHLIILQKKIVWQSRYNIAFNLCIHALRVWLTRWVINIFWLISTYPLHFHLSAARTIENLDNHKIWTYLSHNFIGKLRIQIPAFRANPRLPGPSLLKLWVDLLLKINDVHSCGRSRWNALHP